MALCEGTKNTYEIGEAIESKDLKLTDEDKTVLMSKKTCAYYISGRIKNNPSETYPEITDKNLCFNAQKFNDFTDLIDCGYATISFITDEKTYTIKTCYYIDNKELPPDFINILRDYLFDDDSDSSLEFFTEIYNHLTKDKKGRRLSSLNYEVIVENKNGKKIKYTNDDKQYISISEGNEEEENSNKKEESSNKKEESSNEKEESSKGFFIKFNIILLLSLLFFGY